MSTYFPKEGEIVRKWFVVDADGQRSGAWLRRWRASLWAKRIRDIRRFSIPAIM